MERVATQANPRTRWLGVEPDDRTTSAFLEAARRVVARDEAERLLGIRGVPAARAGHLVADDALRLAHGLSVLTDADAARVLGGIVPPHVAEVLHRMEHRLDHVGREMALPVDVLLDVWHEALRQLDLPTVVMAGPSATDRGDLVFGSVQVVDAIRVDDPSVEAVTIARAFVRASEEAAPVSVELFHAGHRDGSGAQDLSYMEARMASLTVDPERTVSGVLPICHVSVEVEDRRALDEVHHLAVSDRSGLLTAYAKDISVNPGDGSHNTKIAVQRSRQPSAPRNVLEFVWFE